MHVTLRTWPIKKIQEDRNNVICVCIFPYSFVYSNMLVLIKEEEGPIHIRTYFKQDLQLHKTWYNQCILTRIGLQLFKKLFKSSQTILFSETVTQLYTSIRLKQ